MWPVNDDLVGALGASGTLSPSYIPRYGATYCYCSPLCRPCRCGASRLFHLRHEVVIWAQQQVSVLSVSNGILWRHVRVLKGLRTLGVRVRQKVASRAANAKG